MKMGNGKTGSGSNSKKRATSRIDYTLLNNATMHAKISDNEGESTTPPDEFYTTVNNSVVAGNHQQILKAGLPQVVHH